MRGSPVYEHTVALSPRGRPSDVVFGSRTGAEAFGALFGEPSAASGAFPACATKFRFWRYECMIVIPPPLGKTVRWRSRFVASSEGCWSARSAHMAATETSTSSSFRRLRLATFADATDGHVQSWNRPFSEFQHVRHLRLAGF